MLEIVTHIQVSFPLQYASKGPLSPTSEEIQSMKQLSVFHSANPRDTFTTTNKCAIHNKSKQTSTKQKP